MSADPHIVVADYPHGRVPREVRERQLLDLAEELFAAHGYDGVSMDELARAAGISKPVVYDLVSSKEALFRRCFERSGEELAERIAAAALEHGGDVESELRATARAFFAFVDDHRRAWSVLFSLDTGGRTQAAVAGIRARQASFVAARFLALAPWLDPRRAEAAAYALNGAYESLAHWRTENPPITADELADWLVGFALPGLKALLEGD